ncbi:hypothetical protein OKA05_07575 [Luteolibacter arcticus]|uniref:Uncharacterized protein n=1 Tax=Luteolibacter arcticus TaxID=1581411 RepID=A0ABT3GFK7_9BACT|nr:hypothetical protein [Luteolibacter arcticus]MCW1922409.1 hypothetical protein [Luteolibacter arcticus]
MIPGQVILAMSASKVQILLDESMVGQILDALEVRREAWEKTSAYFRGELNDPFFSIEECTDADEADQIAAYYLEIECELRKQWDRHRAQSLGEQSGNLT